MRLDAMMAILGCLPGQSRTADARRLSEHLSHLCQKDVVRCSAVAVGNVSPLVDDYIIAQSCQPQQPRHLLVAIGGPDDFAGPEKAGQCLL